IRFEGHPDLRRILLWEGFGGHPLRKDWHEPYYEEENKPYKSRWPEGNIRRAEDKNPFNNNIAYPSGFDPSTVVPDNDQKLYESLKRSIRGRDPDLDTDVVMVNMGPQHPSTHGVFRIAVALEGEKVVSLK